ncbi:MAG TPA: hypothetical protein VEX68_08900 [Bryobacteraceae bacterium]|nr:hypothetical protein [Bryobacteraceae bacterium]
MVLVMVLYHWLNYFVGTLGFYYRYMRFLTPSFIFIVGFLVAHVYLSGSKVPDTRVPKRLLIRGLKLFVIFLVLNLMMKLLPSTSSPQLTDWGVYIGQNSDNGRAAFAVFLPIAYLLVAAAGISLLMRLSSYMFDIAAIAVMGIAVLLENTGRPNAFMELIGTGLLGTVIGTVPISRIDSVLRHHTLVAIAYAAYLAAITLWNEIYVLQIVGVCLSLSIMYLIGTVAKNRTADAVVLLGKYSLVGYIVQITIFQGLHRMAKHTGDGAATEILYLGVATGLTFVAIVMLDHIKARVPLIRKLYAAVFA